MKFRSLRALALTATLLAVASCGSDDDASDSADNAAPVETTEDLVADSSESSVPGGAADDTTNAPAEQSSEPYRIGLIIEETGNAAAFKEPTVQGYQTALEELAGTSSRPFEIETCDGGSTPDMAIACYDRLVGRDGVDALLGPTVSASGLAITPAVNEDNIISYFLGGGYGGRTMEGNPTQFGANATNTDVLAAIWSWAVKEGMEDVYMISTADATGQACRDFFDQDEFEEERSGLEILGQDEMAIDAQSAAPQMSNVPTDADLLVLCGTGGAGVVMATSYAQSGLEMPAMKLHSQALPAIESALAGALPDDKVYVAGFCPMAAAKGELEEGYVCSESTLAFTEKLQELFPDAVPTFLSAATYDAVMQLAAAVQEVGEDPNDIVAWFESQTGLPGANGVYTFGPDLHRGMGPDSVIIGVWRGDGFHLDSMNDMPAV
ncbi:MAG: ABC transporter substrate-binding protein [Solirubrobacterales bacterium]